jgi:AhpD family alkylhydroperoxidase
MAQVPLIGEQDKPELAALVTRIKAERGGRLLNLYKALLNSPPIAEGWLALFTAIRQRAQLDADCRELAILRVALINRADYEHAAHVPHALKAGISQQKIDDLPAWQVSDCYTPRERAVLACTDAMTTRIDVPAAIMSSLKQHFNDREVVELATTIGGYNLVSRVLVALAVDHEEH